MNANKYIVTIRRSDSFGMEEYDGGSTIAEARKEAAFFVANTPSNVPVKICTVNGVGSLIWKETVREGES